MLTHHDIRQRFVDFWKSKGHVEVPPIPLVPQNDPTTLFTGSGMQQLVPNLLGETHPLGTRLYNIQRCVRAQDIDEVGDNRHDTFFEMMGNWSLGDYFKKDQLPWVFELYTNKEYGFGLDPARLYVTVCGGGEGMNQDDESIDIWKKIFAHVGLKAGVGTADTFHPEQRITMYGVDKNWWSRSGTPHNMPVGEVGGPDSEIFYDFGESYGFHETALLGSLKDTKCHVNCDCGRFLEIGNSVFMQYVKQADGSLSELPKKNVDFGGGFERVLAATNNDPDVFKTDVFAPIIAALTPSYANLSEQDVTQIRIIADHLRTSVMLAADHVSPSPKEQGYILRTLIRRVARASRRMHFERDQIRNAISASLVFAQTLHTHLDPQQIQDLIIQEITKYQSAIENGKKTIAKTVAQKPNLTGEDIFNLYQSIGVPAEEVAEIVKELGGTVDMTGFEEAKKAHSDSSRAGSEQKFKGGLADNTDQVVRYHTATHLLHQALCDVLGDSVRQEGSNITGERLRFDFRSDRKPTPEEITKVATIVNERITQTLPVQSVVMPKEEAEHVGAKSFFKEKYPEKVKVYYVGDSLESAYSKEFCGGPHVANTKEIGNLHIVKLEKIGQDMYRIYAT